MTPSQLAAVQSTADVLISVGDQVAEVFYKRLFELAPDVRPLFANDMQRQKAKLIETLVTLVNHISSRDMFAGYLARLGRHHAGLGVMNDHYGPVAVALLASLESVLGPRFTPEVRAAWTALYGDIQTAMLVGSGV